MFVKALLLPPGICPDRYFLELPFLFYLFRKIKVTVVLMLLFFCPTGSSKLDQVYSYRLKSIYLASTLQADQMPKNIIICCDGTGNQFGHNNSNVVKLYSVIEKEPGKQIAYYDPGVGTNQSAGLSLTLKASMRRIIGLATGYGLYQNVYEAYAYLMENFEPGDQVYLFGFSRGAYTVRVLSGFIKRLGLLEKGCQNLIPYAFNIYSSTRQKPIPGTDKMRLDNEIAYKFRARFSRKCPIKFLGIWDTVSSIGYFGNWKSYPYTANNSNVDMIRHALAIDERRAFYTQNKLGQNKRGTDIKEVWFAGVHSDVGGSYPEQESGLAKVALQWMLNEAEAVGLKVNTSKYKEIVLDHNNEALDGPDPNSTLHRSLKGAWWIGEIIPRSKYDYQTRHREWYIPLGRNREIPEAAIIHQSVFQRMEQSAYQPGNLPKDYKVEPIVDNIASPG